MKLLPALRVRCLGRGVPHSIARAAVRIIYRGQPVRRPLRKPVDKRIADHTDTPNCQRVGRCGSAARRDRGGTLTAMRMADADDLVAVDVANAAQVTAEPVSMTLVRRVVDDLLTHPPECGCGHCEAAAIARAKDVWDIASGWQKAVAPATR